MQSSERENLNEETRVEGSESEQGANNQMADAEAAEAPEAGLGIDPPIIINGGGNA